MKILEGFRPRLIGLASAALVVAGCGGSANDDLPLITASVSIKNIAMGGECDTIPVRMVPKTLDEKANKYANARQMVLEVPTEGPTDENGAPMCNGSAETLPLHTGTWSSVPLCAPTRRAASATSRPTGIATSSSSTPSRAARVHRPSRSRLPR